MNIKLFRRKKKSVQRLAAAYSNEEINTLGTTGLLFENYKNSLFIRNSANTPTKVKKMNLMLLTTILMMKQVKMKMVLQRSRKV